MFLATQSQCNTDPILMQDLGGLRFCDMKLILNVDKGGTPNETAAAYVYRIS